jgi:type III restriction enzyme
LVSEFEARQERCVKLHFESDLPYQIEAIEAVCDLFRGQEVCRSVFTVTAQALSGAVTQQSFEGKQFTESGGGYNRE